MRIHFDQDSAPMPELWQAAYRILEQSLGSQLLRTWIQPLAFQGTETTESGVRVLLAAPNDFSANWVRDNFQRALESAFAQVTGSPCQIRLSTAAAPAQPEITFEPPVEYRPQVAAPAPESRPSAVKIDTRALHENTLDPRYTFESYVVGASNQFAHASAVAVAEQPARQYNPLFIYSPPGLGKTHLLHAIGNHLLVKNPMARVAYLSAEKFVNELIESISHNRMSAFRNKYRDSYDLILIDDIQFIAGKGKSEEEFFHTFNALHSSKRQIVMTSDRPPKEIEKLEERLRTRFEWGLVSDIIPPEIETRIAILKCKAEREDIYLPDDVATFLATYIKSNVRELEGVLVKLQAQSSLTGAEISLEMAKQQLKTAVPEEGSHFTVESIQQAVTKYYHLKLPDLKSTSRAQNVTMPRQIAMYLIRKYTGIGLKEIGAYFGGKDHTTVMHACKKVESGIEANAALREQVEAIQNLL